MIFKVSANICFHESVSQKLKDLTQSDLTRDISCAIHICVCVCVCVYIHTHTHTHLTPAVFNLSGTRGWFQGRQLFFHGPGKLEAWSQGESSILHFCALLLRSLTHQLHLRSSGIRSWRPLLYRVTLLNAMLAKTPK